MLREETRSPCAVPVDIMDCLSNSGISPLCVQLCTFHAIFVSLNKLTKARYHRTLQVVPFLRLLNCSPAWHAILKIEYHCSTFCSRMWASLLVVVVVVRRGECNYLRIQCKNTGGSIIHVQRFMPHHTIYTSHCWHLLFNLLFTFITIIPDSYLYS